MKKFLGYKYFYVKKDFNRYLRISNVSENALIVLHVCALVDDGTNPVLGNEFFVFNFNSSIKEIVFDYVKGKLFKGYKYVNNELIVEFFSSRILVEVFVIMDVYYFGDSIDEVKDNFTYFFIKYFFHFIYSYIFNYILNFIFCEYDNFEIIFWFFY